jgi:D-serine deaminase-like pyridoxal phosphate-dependent protein
MPLTGEYAPSPVGWVRDEVDEIERTGGSAFRDRPVVLLTTVGARTGLLRKTPLMRVEHAGSYAVVASMAGADKHPAWYANACHVFPSYVDYQSKTRRRIPVLLLSAR